MSPAELIAAFESGAAPPDLGGHEGHVRLGWAYLRAVPTLVALDRFGRALRAHARAHGAEGKVHQTITWGWLLVIGERLARAPDDVAADWDRFAAANADLLDRGALSRWWSDALLASDLARRVFVMPDRAAAPTDPAPRARSALLG